MRGAPDVAASRVGSAESPVTVLCIDGDSLDRAQGLSDRLDAPVAVCEAGCSEAAFIPEPGPLYLKVSRDGLSLMRDGMELRPDFAEMLPRIKQGALQREMLVKAARVKGVEAPRAVDATAGLGEDSLLLAAAGFTVTLCEADPVIAALLEDALARASAHEVLGPATAGLGEDSLLLAAAGFTVTLCEADPVIAALLEDALARASAHEVLGPIVERMHLVAGDSRIALERAGASTGAQPDVVYLDPMFPGRTKSAAVKKKFQLIHGAGDSRIALERAGASTGAQPDVVYLDPMFPGRTKSAAVKKKFQLIHGLERPTEPLDEESLLQAALAARPRKVVIKRPVKGPYLAGVKPSHSIAGKAVRYDCIVPSR